MRSAKEAHSLLRSSCSSFAGGGKWILSVGTEKAKWACMGCNAEETGNDWETAGASAAGNG